MDETECSHGVDLARYACVHCAERFARERALEEAARVAESYEPQCESCPRGVASAIRALVAAQAQKPAAPAPRTWTRERLDVLMESAMEKFEAEAERYFGTMTDNDVNACNAWNAAMEVLRNGLDSPEGD